ncbi:MAG: hypothetical protein I8H91_10035 [Burkholderiales bacterium]|nr:hypothetical protein [Burkholderiales bacterium]
MRPYSFAVDEARDKGLSLLATQLPGKQARLMLRPSIPYGEEPQDALRNLKLDDGDAPLTAVLFNLAATPENFAESEAPAFWQTEVARAMVANEKAVSSLWSMLRAQADAATKRWNPRSPCC